MTHNCRLQCAVCRLGKKNVPMKMAIQMARRQQTKVDLITRTLIRTRREKKRGNHYTKGWDIGIASGSSRGLARGSLWWSAQRQLPGSHRWPHAEGHLHLRRSLESQLLLLIECLEPPIEGVLLLAVVLTIAFQLRSIRHARIKSLHYVGWQAVAVEVLLVVWLERTLRCLITWFLKVLHCLWRKVGHHPRPN